MKQRKVLIFFCMVCIVMLSGCKGVESCPAVYPTLGAESSPSEEENSDNTIFSDMFSQSIYAALQAEWSAWNTKDDMQKAVSSHLPGHIYKQFDTWAECEEFVGTPIFNPLEDSEFEKGSYVGMPEGANDASRFYISLYGESPEKVNWIHVQSGYRDKEVGITINAKVFPYVATETTDAEEPLITEDSGERYVAAEALFVRESVTYTIRAVGGKGEWNAVRKTLSKVLPYFDKAGF